MFRVLIADDEPHHLKRLGRLIEETGLPFKICGTASDGGKAMEMASVLKPDVILCDIKMPFRDGLSLSEAVKKESPEVQIILISAYENFEYARTGLKLGILDYLLKPVDLEMITSVLKKAEQTITETKTNFLRRLFFNVRNKNAMTSKEISHVLAGLKPYRLALYLNQPVKAASLSSLWHTQGWYFPVYCLELETRSDGTRLFLFSGKTSAKSTVFNDSGISRGILYLSEDNPEYEEWERCCREMSNGIWGRGKWGQSAVLEKSRSKSRPFKKRLLTPEEDRELCVMLKNSRIDEFSTLLEKILNTGLKNRLTLGSLIDGLRELGERTISEYAARMNIDQSQVRQLIEALIDKLPSLEFSPAAVVNELTMQLQTLLPQETVPSFSIQRIVEYIQKNYSKNIDSSSLADRYGMSANLLNRIFKAEMGISPTKYLISVRIEAAKKLLSKEPSMQIKNIAVETGYDDPLYFSRIFHKRTGMYPTEYRERFEK
ncbi:MAG: hypothetical protein CSA81_02480 [Acidobacteria bacterium]|nr:MAG: hypothetical protein CSA81_02480 [Acidobacteriota bacterium]